jgi:LCP family protein required for cell wall assembly
MTWTPRWRVLVRRFVVACGVLSVATAGAVVVGNRYGRNEFAKRTVVHLNGGVLAPAVPAQPANFLLVGHDATGHSDTMMVVHLDPQSQTPLLVSFPRDLIVDIPGHGSGQLNAAIGFGGPALLIETFSTDFHIPIQHYLQVDFASFPQIVNAIGHIKVWFPTPVHDPYIGLNIDRPGCVSLGGAAALAYVRSRHYYVPDNLAHPTPWSWDYPAQSGGQGWTAGGSDIDRIPRQQYFLRTLAQALISKTSDNPLRIISVVDAVMTHLKTDQVLTFNELKAFIGTFQRVKPANVAMTTLPWQPDPSNNNRVIVKYPEATTVLDQLANFTPPKLTLPTIVNPHTVTIRVVNGAGIAGLAANVQAALVQAGFRAAGPPANADRSDYTQTQIRYAPGKTSQGATVLYATGARHLGQSPSTSDTLGGDVLVIVGRDWNSLRHHLTGLTSSPTPTNPHVTTGTTQPTITTTSVDRRYIPVDPKTGGVLVGCPA